MRLFPKYCLLLPLVLLTCLSACRREPAEQIDWRVYLDHEKKTPYGSSLAYESFPGYFPAAKREALTKYFRYTGLQAPQNAYSDSVQMIVLLGLRFRLSEAEWLRLLRFARNGNEVFLLAADLDPKICRDLGLRVHQEGSEHTALAPWNSGERSQECLSLSSDSTARYGFTGRYINRWFESGTADTSREAADRGDDEDEGATGSGPEEDVEAADALLLRHSIDTAATVLGHSRQGPDFIRYRIGNGHLTLHAAPLVLSNYFLLQPENRPYLDGIWHSFPANVSRVYWNEFFERRAERSSFSGLLRYPAMRYALLIAGLTLLLYVLFSMKRRQRIIPVIAPPENASVSFVETVGRLYFNKGNHLNLAEKMVQHFLEWVRTNYYLETSKLDQAFVEHLSRKSGKPVAEVQTLIDIIHQMRLGSAPASPEFLYDLYRRIQSFYQ